MYSDLFDALVAALGSRGDPPNDAELISYCSHIMPNDCSEVNDEMVRNTLQATLLFEEAASNVLIDQEVQCLGIGATFILVCRWKAKGGCK